MRISGIVPDGGATTASKTTYLTGQALLRAADSLLHAAARALDCRREDLVLRDGGINGREWRDIFPLLPAEDRSHEGEAEFRYVEERYEFGVHHVYSYLSQIVGVEVNTLTGEIRVLKTEMIPAAGKVINPLGFEGQCEGGAVMSLGYALFEDFSDYRAPGGTSKNYQTYLLPTMADMPEIRIYPMEDREESGPFGANGIGESVAVTGTAAITNAVYDAVGIRINDLPCRKETLLLGSNSNKLRKEV